MFWSKKQKAPSVSPDEAFGRLREFVVARSPVADRNALTLETRLFSSGLLDSLAYAELVFFVEESMGVVLSEHGDVTMDSIDRLGDAVDLIVEASS